MQDRKSKEIFVNIEAARVFAQNIRELRIKNGLTQEDFALEANIDRSSIARLEAARQNITLDIILTLAKVLKVDPGTLFAGITLNLLLNNDNKD